MTEKSAMLPSPLRDRATLTLIATFLVIAATSWYLLRELAPLLRPLLLAVFLAYIILPVQARLARRTSSVIASLLLGIAVIGGLYCLGWLTYRSAIELTDDLPEYTDRAQRALTRLREWVQHWPWLGGLVNAAGPNADSASRLRMIAAAIAGVMGDVLGEILVVAVYLLFLLLDAARFPDRVRRGFSSDRADNVLAMVASINNGIASYLKVKVLASVLLAVPAALILALFGVKFALLWGVLTFLFNFIPYIGSVFACLMPIVLAFLQLDLGWQPIAVAALLIADHGLSGYVVEPSLTGRAVNLSPLAILLALGFWGLCWGLVGLLLAVPLTVMLKIVLEHLPSTQPIAALMSGE